MQSFTMIVRVLRALYLKQLLIQFLVGDDLAVTWGVNSSCFTMTARVLGTLYPEQLSIRFLIGDDFQQLLSKWQLLPKLYVSQHIVVCSFLLSSVGGEGGDKVEVLKNCACSCLIQSLLVSFLFRHSSQGIWRGTFLLLLRISYVKYNFIRRWMQSSRG